MSRATNKMLQDWYNEFNSRFFDGRLPPDIEVRFATSEDDKDQLGNDCMGVYVQSQKVILQDPDLRPYWKVLQMNLLHEMVHVLMPDHVSHEATADHGMVFHQSDRKTFREGRLRRYSMKFNLISNIDNGVGLQADCHLLKGLLKSWGHQAELVHYKRVDAGSPRADVNIFLETIASAMFPFAKQQWLIPNQEWFAPWDNNAIMQKMDKILCKTHDAVKIFTELYPELQNRVQHIGFESKDNYDPDVPRQRRFLHIAGQSRYKNSPAVAYAFAKCFDDWDPKDRVELTFVGAYPEDFAFAKDSKNCRYIQRATDAEMKRLQNECLFHIIPSGAEGWGHAIHEGLGVGAVVITTDFPPMNEFAGIPKDLYVRSQRDIQELAARRALVGAYEVREGIEKALKLSTDRIAEISTQARAASFSQREYFRTTFQSIVGVA